MKIFGGIIIAVVLLSIGFFFLREQPAVSTEPTTPVSTDKEWLSASSSEFSYQYPESIDAAYISAMDWPPLVEKVVNEYTCAVGEAAVDGPATKVEERLINEKTYCVSVATEGAAGSTYVSYDYVTEFGKDVFRVYFSLRYPQCENYDEPNQTSCQKEQSTFSIDQLTDSIVSTITVK